MIFHRLQDIDWKTFGVVLAAVILFWLGLQSILPEWLFHRVNVVLMAGQTVVTFLMRATKFVKRDDSSGEIPVVDSKAEVKT